MPPSRSFFSVALVLILTATSLLPRLTAAATPAAADTGVAEKKTLNALFIGNSYTARHNLAQVVKAMAEAGNPGLDFNVTTVIYGGRTLADHWRLGTRNFVNLSSLTAEEEKATIASLERALESDPEDSHAKTALARHRELLADLDAPHKKWDVVFLQSYRDDLEGDASRYAKFAPKFAEIAHAQGARVVLYETSPTTQNAAPLTAPPDPAPVLKKERAIAALADRIDAAVVPMALAGLRCQEQRPDLTLRYINDAHLNKTMAYLTACTLYAALFDRSPEGLPVDSITDIRFFEDKKENKDKDRDGNPITQTFSKKDAAELQKIAWEAYKEFQKMRGKKPVALADLAARHIKPLVGKEIGGVSVAYGIVRGDEVLTGGFGREGLADADVPDGTTLFEIGSVSKVFTGILLADAVLRGEVAFNDPVQKHLPEGWTVPKFKEREIRLVDLTTHHSALPRIPLMMPGDPENPYADFTLDFLKSSLANTKLQYPPGTKHAYSNLAVGLLGNVLVHSAGVKDYEALLVQRIAVPLGLENTRITLEEKDRARLAQPIALNGEPAKNWDLPAFAGAGAIRSTADDMVRFIRANLHPESTELKAALELAQQPKAGIGKSKAKMGCGWFISPDGNVLDHNGQTGGYHAFLTIGRKSGIGVVIFATGKAINKVDKAGVALMDELHGKSP